MWSSFSVQGGVTNVRQLCAPDFAVAALIPILAFCAGEAYCSHFVFAADALLAHYRTNPMLPAFSCIHWTPFIYIDIDREEGEELPAVWKKTQEMVMYLLDRFGIDARDIIVCFSGGKGFHIAIRTAIWNPVPSLDFCDKVKVFCSFISQAANIKIDTKIYDIMRIIRLPWSKHQSGYHKAPLPMDNIFNLKIEDILELAKRPEPFFLSPHDGRVNSKLAGLWEECGKIVAKTETEKMVRKNAPAVITQHTLDLVANGASMHTRNDRFFEAGANCGEFSTRDDLAIGFLLPAVRKSGFSEVEAIRAIRNGLRKGSK